MKNAVPMIMWNRVSSTQVVAKRNSRNGLIHTAYEMGVPPRGGVAPEYCGLYMSIALEGVFPPKDFMKSVLQVVSHTVTQETYGKVSVRSTHVYLGGKKVADVITEVTGSRTIVGVNIKLKPHPSTRRCSHICADDVPDGLITRLIYTMAQTIGHEILLLAQEYS